MKNFKKIYFGLLLIGIFLVSFTYFSYAFFTSKTEEYGKLNIVVGTLDYKLESNDLISNKITVKANTMKILTINIKSLNTIKSRYELYYKTSDANDLIIGYGDDSEVVGVIDANSSKKITVIIRNISDTSKDIEFGVQGGFISNELVLDSNKTSLYSYCNLKQEYTFDYTGSEQEFVTPCTGQYKIEAWGASGLLGEYVIDNSIGKGGYASGNINMKKNKSLYVYVGGFTGFNGGGSGEAPGGGATDIRLVNGNWNDFNSLKSRIIVAGGGGGGMYYLHSTLIQSGNAGGLIGYDANDLVANHEYTTGYSGHGGTQTAGGLTGEYGYAGYPYSESMNGTFGQGGFADGGSSSGGGGGYYGGGHGRHPGGTWTGGGGGSSFISGHNGCDAINEESTENNIIHTGQPNHYSGLVFTNTVMIDGSGYNWTTEKGDTVVGMPTHDGTSTMIGNSGNGYAKITYLGK